MFIMKVKITGRYLLLQLYQLLIAQHILIQTNSK